MDEAPGHAPAEPAPSAAARAFAWAGGALFVIALIYFAYSYLVVFGRPAMPGGWLLPAAINISLFTVFALHHSAFARAGVRDWIHRSAPRLERAIYVWVSSVLFLGVCWLWLPVPGELYRLEGPWAIAARSVQLLGLLLTILGARALDVLDLAGIRQVSGGPAANPAALVTTGVYRLVRHPLYFGWALLVFGTPHMTMTRAAFALISTLYLAVAIPWEERSLTATFGPAYEAYQRRVRWRMLPFVY